MTVTSKYLLFKIAICLSALTLLLMSCSSNEDIGSVDTADLITVHISGKVYYTPYDRRVSQTEDGDALNRVPIDGIQIKFVNTGAVVFSDANGAYIFNEEQVNIGKDNAVALIFTDIDGDANGGKFEDLRIVEDNIVWYDKKATITIDVELTRIHLTQQNTENSGR